jgi:ubiquinone/menaquinone biosynthesis C-methylase UbiE
MGFYANQVLPRLIDFVLSRPEVSELRAAALADASGEVLEIGFGTGLNLAHYPKSVAKLAALDPATMLPRRVETRIAAATFPVERVQCGGEGLPFDARRFDCVVTTFTLCSIAEVAAALTEIRRVLKHSGSYLFLEHGRSENARVARWQDRLNGIQRLIGGGCNLNRQIDRLVRDAGFEITHFERPKMPNTPSILADHYLGRAQIA